MVGQIVSHYEILEKLGGGGMGVVYRAEDSRLKRPVALKFLSSNLTNDSEAKTRFKHEAQAASALDHPNICTIHEIDETAEGQLFICMAFYEGMTLKKRMQQGPFSHQEVLSIAMQTALGLACAHEAGIVHRDLKPANIMLTKHNEVKIVDFGLAKLTGQTEITKAGSPIGTVAYMSPEQTRGELLDNSTDIWSFGVLLYELFSGERPFKGDYDQAIIYSILNESPEPLQNLCPDLPVGIYQIVDRCLQKNQKDRFLQIDEIIESLHQIYPEVTPPGFDYQSGTVKKQPVLFKKYQLLITGVMLLAMVLVIWDLWFSRTAEKHLIILPFKNLSSDVQMNNYGVGLFDLLTSRLTQLIQFNPSLQVISSDVIGSLHVTGVTDAYDKVGATLAITGSLENQENYTQLTLNLVDTRSLRQIDSDVIRIDHNLVDSRIEEALIERVATMLDLDIPRLIRANFFAVSTSRQDAFDYYINGNGYLEKSEDLRNVSTAIHYYNQALAVDSNFTLAYTGLGRAYWQMYYDTKDTVYVLPAINACHKAMELNGHYPESYLTCGIIYKGIGQYENAIEKLKRAIELDPANAQAYWKLGETYSALGDTALASDTYRRAIDIRPGYWQGYSHLGYHYFITGQYAKAEKQFRKIVDLLPNSEKGYAYLAAVYFYREKIDAAIRMAENAAKINPSYKNLNNLAAYYYFTGNYQAAAEKFKNVLDYNQTDYRIWGSLGITYYYTDRKDSAAFFFRKAAELAEGQRAINPRDPVTLVNLASYYIRLGKRDKSYNLLYEVEKMNPSKLDVIFDLGDVYEQLGERDKALFWMEKAIRHNYKLARFTNNPGLKDLMADERFQKIVAGYREGK